MTPRERFSSDFRYTDWTSGEPVEKEWPMTDPALRALIPETCLGTHPPYNSTCTPSCHAFDRAALAAAEAAPLDVERLARAYAAAHGHSRVFGADETVVARIAREYAALRSPDTETAGEAG